MSEAALSGYDRTRDNHRMNSIRYAVDAYDGDMARRMKSKASREKYQDVLHKFIDFLGRSKENVDEITVQDCERFLDQWRDHSGSTMCLHHSVLNGFFKFLILKDALDANPMDKIRRPRRPRHHEVKVVSVSSSDVDRMLEAVAPPTNRLEWDEILCLALLAYTGPRRNAVAMLRRRDLDLERGTITFTEKGNKSITKPVPHELLAILKAADDYPVWLDPEDYLIPNRRPQKRNGERCNRVVYRIVKDVAKRARVTSHVHALRAAFAVRYLDTHPGDGEGLQDLMGHESYETTRIYLRRHDRMASMERVRDLSWGQGQGFRSLEDLRGKDSNLDSVSPQQTSGRTGNRRASDEAGTYDADRTIGSGPLPAVTRSPASSGDLSAIPPVLMRKLEHLKAERL